MTRSTMRHDSQRLAAQSGDGRISVVFVDDDQGLLDGLRRSLRSMRSEWDMQFLNGGEAAMAHINEHLVDVVVSDLAMPGIDGFKVLEYVKKKQPNTIRLILSGNADVSSVVRTIGPAHQFLSKPTHPDILKEVVGRALSLRKILGNPVLTDLVGQMESLPTLPDVFDELQDLLQSDQADLQMVGEIIKKDVAITGKVLKLVNSPFFGMKRTIYDPGEAAAILGVETIRSLVVATHTFSTLDSLIQHFSHEEVWNHSLRVAGMVRAITTDAGLPDEQIEAAYLAGLMHDSGRLVLARAMMQSYDKICGKVTNNRDLVMVERKVFGADHGEIGAYLLGLWGCSDFIVEGIAFHHAPEKAAGSDFSLAMAIHFADAMDAKLQYDVSLNMALDGAYIKKAGLMATLANWRGICEKATMAMEGNE